MTEYKKHCIVTVSGIKKVILEKDVISPNILSYPEYKILTIYKLDGVNNLSLQISYTNNNIPLVDIKYMTEYEFENTINSQGKYNHNLSYSYNNTTVMNMYRKLILSGIIYREE